MKLSTPVLLLAAAAALCNFVLVDAANCSAITTNQYCVYCSRNGRRYVCLPTGGTPCTSGTNTIRRCKDILDKAGTVRADGCFEGMEVEAEPAIFRAKTSVQPSGSGYSQCTSYTITAVRLVNGPNPNAGQLEVLIGGYWGNVVLDDHPNAAQVVCRQLGKKGGTGRTYAYYGFGRQGMVVDRINCATGKERNLTACSVSLNWAFQPADMKHGYDWGVECVDPAAPVPDCSVSLNNRYCSYCNDERSFMACVAQGGTACRVGKRIMKPCLDLGETPATEQRMGCCFAALQKLTASGTYVASYFRGVHTTPPRDLLVNCSARTITGARLVDGSNMAEGRLEVQMGGVWGTVSATFHGISDPVAKVVCHQLGMKGGIIYTYTTFGQNTRLGMLSFYIMCSGKESSLKDCYIDDLTQLQSADIDRQRATVVGVACKDAFQFPKCTALSNNVYCVACSPYRDRHVCLASGTPCSAGGEVIRLCSHVAVDITPAGNGCPLEYALSGVYSFRARHMSWPQASGHSCSDTAVTDVRLVGGPNPNAGRLEVRIGGWWGTVCSKGNRMTGFDDMAAKVACRQLGKSGGIAHGAAFYGHGSRDLGVIMRGTRCTGAERNLSACTFDASGVCDHGEDVGVECNTHAAPPLCSALPANRYCVSCRIGDGSDVIRYVCLANGGTTCKSGSGAVIRPCVDLVFSDEYHLPQGCYLYHSLQWPSFGQYAFRTELATLPTGNGAECASKKVTGIRLVRGPTTPANAGRLEVQIGGVWGSVCAEQFGPYEAQVACRQLGKKGGVPHGYSRYGAAPAGTPALMVFEEVFGSSCNGNEASLTNCQWGFTTSPCAEGEAGLECAA